MRKLGILFSALLLMCFAASFASATTITIFQAETQKDGGAPVAAPLSGLGSFTVGLGPGPAGSHYVVAFVDPEIDEAINTFFNEIGSAFGSPAAGQSWEIDEPGFVYGDIYTNFLAGALDNSNGVLSPDDVSMALGWNFVLTNTQVASISFALSDIRPSGGFYLTQTDPDSQASIYFSSQLNIRDTGGPGVVPEPSTIILMLSGLGLAAAARFRKSV